MPYDYVYEKSLRTIAETGYIKGDRTGTGTKSLPGLQMRFDLKKGFPLITTKFVPLRVIFEELNWFLSGSTNIKPLLAKNVHIWDEWADADGELGPVYGYQWRSWPQFIDFAQGKDKPLPEGLVRQGTETERITSGTYMRGIDQITNVVERIKSKPDDRRLIVSAWNPAQIDQMKLPPCHCLFQFYTRLLSSEERVTWWHSNTQITPAADMLEVGETISDALLDAMSIPTRGLSCMLYQRSADYFLGAPFNIASYALLTEMVAQQVGMIADQFVWTGGDCHIYSNHTEQVVEQLTRVGYDYPTIQFKRKPDTLFDYTWEDIELLGYQHHPAIKAPVAV